MRTSLLGLGLIACSHPHSTVPEPTGPLEIVVTRNAAPVAGAAVVFHDPDGALVATATTDASGHAATELAVNQATVIEPGMGNYLTTVAHVEPGEPITIPLDWIENPPLPAIAKLTVQAPPGTPPAGTAGFVIHTGCGTWSTTTFPKTIDVAAECIGRDGNVPVVVAAWTEPQSLEDPGMPLASTAGIATRAGADFALSPGAWSTACRAIDVVNPRPMGLQLWPRYDGVELRGVDASYCQPPIKPGFDYAYPLLALDDGVTESIFSYAVGANQMVFKTSDLPATPTTLSVEHDPDILLGKVDLTAMDASGATWRTPSELAGVDVIVAKLTYVRGPGRPFVRWKLIEPGWASSADLPELPASLGDAELVGVTNRMSELRYLDGTWLAGAAQAQRALGILLGAEEPYVTLPAGGTIREYRQQDNPDAN